MAADESSDSEASMSECSEASASQTQKYTMKMVNEGKELYSAKKKLRFFYREQRELKT